LDQIESMSELLGSDGANRGSVEFNPVYWHDWEAMPKHRFPIH